MAGVGECGRVWGHVAQCVAMWQGWWQGVGGMWQGWGYVVGVRPMAWMGTCGRGGTCGMVGWHVTGCGDMWQGVGSCGRGWRHATRARGILQVYGW